MRAVTTLLLALLAPTSALQLHMSTTLPGSAARVGSVYERLSSSTLTSASTGEPVVLSSLWSEDETCVVEMLRHFG